MPTRQVVLRERCNCPGVLTRRRRFLLGATANGKLDIPPLARAVRLAGVCGLLMALSAAEAQDPAKQDGSALIEARATIPGKINGDNDAASNTTAGEPIIAVEGGLFTYGFGCYWDPPQERAICVWANPGDLPAGADLPTVYGSNSVTSTITWRPTFCQSGPYTLVWRCGEVCFSELKHGSHDLTVNNVNRPPTITTGGSTSIEVTEGTPIHIDVTGTDPDTQCSDPLNKDILKLEKLSGPGAFVDVGGGIGEFDLASPTVGIYHLTIQLDDHSGGTAIAPVEIRVYPEWIFVKIVVDFDNTSEITESCTNKVTATPSNLSADAKTRVINKITEKYADALGAGKVTVEAGAVGQGVGTGDYAVIISGGFGPLPPKRERYGDAGAGKGKPGIVHDAEFIIRGFADTGLSNAVGESAAHEVAHQIYGGGHNGLKGKLMTDGDNLTKEQREANNRSFSVEDEKKLHDDLKKNTTPKSTGTAKDVVSGCGVFPPSSSAGRGEGPDFIPDDLIWDAVVWYEGERPGLEIGYINEDGAFIFQGDATEPGDPELNSSVGVMSLPGHGEETQRWVLALKDGFNVYGFNKYGVGEPILSDTNPLNDNVFRKVELQFDLDEDGFYDHSVFLDSSLTSPTTGGFTQVGACCAVADNQCSQVTEAECKALGKGFTYRGDGSPCGSDGTCIPTVSEWGLLILAMLLLCAGTIRIGRRTPIRVSREA